MYFTCQTNLLHERTYRDGFALQFVSSQFSQRPESVLPTVHADESAATWRDQVDGYYLAVLTKCIRQLFLLDQLAQVTDPERSTTNA